MKCVLVYTGVSAQGCIYVIFPELTETKRSSQASDDSDRILGICAELQKYRGKGIPFAFQLQKKNHFKLDLIQIQRD